MAVTALIILTTPDCHMTMAESSSSCGERNKEHTSAESKRLHELVVKGHYFGIFGNKMNNHLRNRRAANSLAIFRAGNVIRWLIFYKVRAFELLMHGATRYSASGKTAIFQKKGNFQQAMLDFDSFDPYDIKTFKEANGVYGVSAKIKGKSDVHVALEAERPELSIVVRNWSTSPQNSPTLEIFPSYVQRSRSFRLKMRYVDN